MTTQHTKRPIGLISIDTKTVYDCLVKTTVGETVTYDKLQALIGRSVRGGGKWILYSARRKALNEDGVLFATVSKIGVKRLSDAEIVDVGHDTVSRIHRESVRGIRKIATVRDYNSLPAEAKLRHGVYASALGMLAHITKGKQIERLREKVQQSQATLPLQKTLEAFRES